MINQAQSLSVTTIIQLAQRLSPIDKAILLNSLVEETGLSVVLGNQTASNVLIQIDGLDNNGKADVMSAIAESLRSQVQRN